MGTQFFFSQLVPCPRSVPCAFALADSNGAIAWSRCQPPSAQHRATESSECDAESSQQLTAITSMIAHGNILNLRSNTVPRSQILPFLLAISVCPVADRLNYLQSSGLHSPVPAEQFLADLCHGFRVTIWVVGVSSVQRWVTQWVNLISLNRKDLFILL